MIYHYTTIETLALILHNKTLRFNRLDKVDDLEESIYGSGTLGTKLGKYCFVSCWTTYEAENLALWNMYASNKGVRIGFKDIPLKTYPTTFGFRSFIKDDTQYGDGYVIHNFNNPANLYDVEYVDNPQELIHDLEGCLGQSKFWVKPEAIGIYKHKEWEFQRESRFKILIAPCDKSLQNKQSRNIDEAYAKYVKLKQSSRDLLLENKDLPIKHIDLPLEESKLNEVEVMLGPQTSEADRIIVDALLKDFPEQTLKTSRFWRMIRVKSS